MKENYRLVDEWVQAAKNGDKKAKELLLLSFKPLILSMVQKYIYNPADYADGLQEGAVVLLETLKAFDSEQGVVFPFYLKNCLFHYFVERAKSHKKEKAFLCPTDAQSLTAQQDSQTLEVESAFEEEQRLRQKIWEKLNTLPYKQKEVLFLRYYRGLSVKTIAALKGESANTVEKRRRAGIERLKRAFGRV